MKRRVILRTILLGGLSAWLTCAPVCVWAYSGFSRDTCKNRT